MPLPTLDNTPRPRARGYGARLNLLLLRLAVSPDRAIKIQSAPLEAPRVNTAGSSEDIRSEFGALFSRVAFDGGEGLAFAHRADNPDGSESRYWDSMNVDVSPRSAVEAGVRLLHVGEQIDSVAGGLTFVDGSPIALAGGGGSLDLSTAGAAMGDTNLHFAFDGTALYVAAGTVVRRSTTFHTASHAFVDDDPHAGQGAVDVNDLCAVGGDVFAALDTSGIHRRDGSTDTWAQFSAFAAVRVWAAKGILFASNGTELASVDLTTGTATTQVTLPDGTEWVGLVDAGGFILAAATDGHIYALAVDESAALGLRAQTYVGANVQVRSIAARHGFVFWATAEVTENEVVAHWWRGAVSSSGVLTDAQLIRTFGREGDGIDRTPNAMAATDDAVFLPVVEANRTFIWRYDLATGGRARWWGSRDRGLPVDAIAVWGEVYWSLAGKGVYRRSLDVLAEDGWLIGPLGDLFTASAKAWVSAMLDTAAVTAGRVELFYTVNPAAIHDHEHPSWKRVRQVSGSVLPDIEERGITDVESRFVAGMLRLYPNSDRTAGPTARGFTFRAYPGSSDVLIELPVNVSDQIEMPNRRRIKVRGLGQRVWDAVKVMEGDSVELELFDPDELVRGVVEQVSAPVSVQSERGTSMLVAVVRVRGRRVSGPGGVDTSSGWGAQVWGSNVFGSHAT